jgi:hypothetical protein
MFMISGDITRLCDLVGEQVKNLKEILEEKSESAAQEKRELQVANTELKEVSVRFVWSLA